jgi:anaerobic ribonucleoside-triphosphate reductase activating protein
MRIQLNRAHYPVTVLGPGRRIGLWTQGCGIGCPGCVALDTWAPDPGTEIEVADLVGWCGSVLPRGVDGVTISGGEPFDQPEALDELLGRLRAWRARVGSDIDLLCYSGRSLSVLRRRFPHILDQLDAVVPGRFVAARAPGLKWRGSANQKLVPLSPLGHRRYDAEIDRVADAARLQVAVAGSTVFHVGVPQPGDLDALEDALERRGVRYREVSWRS